MRIWRTAAALLVLALPQTAAACAQLSPNVWMCARDTVWDTAQWDQYGDGATLLLEGFTFNFFEDFPGAELAADNASLSQQYAAYAAFIKSNQGDDYVAPDIISTKGVTAGTVMAHRVLQYSPWGGSRALEAAMIAKVGDAPIFLSLEAPEATQVAVMDAMSLQILGLLHSSCADAETCTAEDKGE